MAMLVVTSQDWELAGQAARELRSILPAARVRRRRLRGVFVVEAEGDVLQLAEAVTRECGRCTGHATAVLTEVESASEAIRVAAVRVGSEQIRENETFCFRINKRGAHRLAEDTPTLEREIGGAIWQALERKYGARPRVDLTDPDVKVIAEVLGPDTAVGIVRKAWRSRPEPASPASPSDGP